MQKIRNFTEANAALLPYVQLVHSLFGTDTALRRIAPLMEAAGNPQERLRIIHLAGTSGKTSTAYYVSALLTASGKRVGLTVSPHVDTVAERVQINGVALSEQEFCVALGEFLEIVETLAEKPTYFEILYALSFWVFDRAGVDYAVVETGVGGLYDPTNIATRADKLCIITDIGYDHMQVLGDTLNKIAAQKAGIIHSGETAIMYKQPEEVMAAIHERVEQEHAQLIVTTEVNEAKKYQQLFRDNMPEYQQRNWLLAYKAYRWLAKRDSLPQHTIDTLRMTQRLQVPARMDIRTVGKKIIIMDGAHNAQKMQTFLASFMHEYPDIKPAILISLKEGKEPQDLGPMLAPLAARVIITTFSTSQDLPAKSINPDDLAKIFRASGVQDLQIISDHHEAYRALLAVPEKICIITGSFYLLSQIREEEHLQ